MSAAYLQHLRGIQVMRPMPPCIYTENSEKPCCADYVFFSPFFLQVRSGVMPALRLFGRKWLAASDDLVFPGLFEVSLRTLW